MIASSPSSETLDALQTLIEAGGLERELTIQLRKKYLDMTEREETAPAPRNLTERAEP